MNAETQAKLLTLCELIQCFLDFLEVRATGGWGRGRRCGLLLIISRQTRLEYGE